MAWLVVTEAFYCQRRCDMEDSVEINWGSREGTRLADGEEGWDSGSGSEWMPIIMKEIMT